MIYKLLFFVLVASSAINAQTYNAAVLEYSPTIDTSLSDADNVLANAQLYVTFIQQAVTRNSRIIVFPEYGLTSTVLPANLADVATIVPDASQTAIPCTNTTGYAKFFVDLSCGARTHILHTVVNLIESETSNSTNTTLFYNTNVVFDTNGAVVARYRKMNLFNEPGITAGNETVTFTAFGVTFGLFTCFDILFRRPAQEVLERGATDIIYPTAWTSETPFHQALSVQDGYAKATGVNLLAAGYNNVTNGMAGAAIYLANGTIAASSFRSVGGQNIIFGTLNVIAARSPDAVCSNNIGISPRFGGTIPDITATLALMHENMALYTFQSLERGELYPNGTVCSEDFCCNYSIELADPFTASTTIYKMVAFYGTRGFQGAVTSPSTIGVRTCALVACQTDDNLSCGRFNSTTIANFNRITINGTVKNNENTFYQPTTLGTDHNPLPGYAYCTTADTGSLNFTLRLDSPQNVFTFGIFGREFSIDGRPAAKGGVDSILLNSHVVIAIFSAYLCMKLLQ